MKVVGTGLSGLVGSRVVDLLSRDFLFTNLSLETGIDITDHSALETHIAQTDAPWVFHFAAMTDVDGCEKDKEFGENGVSWKINVEATRQIAEICRNTGKHMLSISTDYVFDGTKESYTEEDIPNPQGWYGITKFEGEKYVNNLGPLGLIIRIANPYRTKGPGKPDFVHKILDRLRQNLPVASPVDSTFCTTFIDDIANAIQILVNHNAAGLYHVVGEPSLSQYEAVCQIAKIFSYNPQIIAKTTFAEFFKNRAPRPLHADLINGRIKSYGITMRSFHQGLLEVKQQDKGGNIL